MHRITGGRRVPKANLHLTLAFVGSVSQDQLRQLQSPPARVFPQTFILKLDTWGCWNEKGIGWLGPSHIPASLRSLAENLGDWLRAAGIKLETRPFAPHVTLVRRANDEALPAAMTPLDWPVSEVVLLDSVLTIGGARYSALGAWKLEPNSSGRLRTRNR